ncbi:hypothetical protein KP509_1Z271800 [Ceratopteris richardii]|nr:hypothetical protein KP509_1Z271800 [Ceratopteris richardii]
MEGAPSLHGYTIKEAVTLARSMVPAQRAAALRLIDNILNKAMSWLHAGVWDDNSDMPSTDWQAVHAYALGPEPELALTLRIALDDSHATAVVTCARALESLLSSSVNENYFSLCESLLPNEYCAFTAPVFKKPFFKETGLMEDCYWKLNVKPTDMFPYSKKDQSQEENSEATVKDDTYISNQDIASGLIRMGILPRIRYLLEVERLTAAEDSLFNILIALSRHSQAAANAVMNCPRLMGTIHELFVLDETLTWSVRQKAVKLLKVLSIAKMSNCIEICNMGLFEKSLRSLLHQSLTVATPNQICQSGSWAELAEALSFWRVCIKYGLCISCFSDYYPALLFWIAAPDAHTVLKSFNVRDATLAEGSFHLLEALACTLPILHGAKDMEQSNVESSSDSWSWKSAIPVIETSLEWLSAELVQHFMQKLVQLDEVDQLAKVASKLLLRVMSSVLHFLSTACERIIAKGNSGPSWLPVFVPKVCMRLIRSGILNFNKADESESSILSFTNCLLKFKHKASEEHLLGIVNCIYGLVRLLEILDFLVDSGDGRAFGACELNDVSYTEQIMQCGIVLSVKDGLLQALEDTSDDLMHKSLVSGTVKASRRGGPAPGVGMGWGCKGGGHWSSHDLLTQAELVLVQRLTDLLSSKGILSEDGVEANSISSDPMVPWRLRTGLSILNLAGPYHKDLVETIFRKSIFRTSSVDFYIREADSLVKQWSLKFEEKTSQKIEYDLNSLYKLVPDIRESLLRHIKMMWLAQKAKCKKEEIDELGENPRIEHRSYKKFSTLPTVPEEDPGISQISGIKQLAVQWAGQKLPIPQFWFLSPLLRNLGQNALGDGYITQNIVRYGLLLLSGMEAAKVSFPLNVPIAMKIHSLSNIFVMSDDVFLEKDVNHMIGALQEKLIYDIYLDADGNDERNSNDWKNQSSSMLDRSANEISLLNLDFQSLVDERYSSFLDKLTSQFSSVSYGDLVFGRQITIYLTMDVPVYLRLRVWKSLESEHMLHFLPPLNKCPGPSKIYLYPLLESQESQDLMKAYASSLTSGALDRARARGSVSFSIAIFSVASFIFSRSRGHDADSSKMMFAKDFMLQLAQSSQFQVVLHLFYDCTVCLSGFLNYWNMLFINFKCF